MKAELSNGVTLNYEVQGSDPNLILIHGNGSDHHDFDSLLPRLSEHFTVYGVDSRGQGESSHQGEYVNYAQMAEDYALFIKENNLDSVSIMGHSDGAIIGTLLGIEQVESLSHLVLLSVSLNTEDITGEVKGLLQYMVDQDPDNPLLQLMLVEPKIPHEDLKKIQVPSLVVAADNDVMPLAEYAKIADYLPNSQTYIIPGANHVDLLLGTDRLADEVIRFLQQSPEEISRQNESGVFGQNLDQE